MCRYRVLVWACATTEQTRSVEPSGFLGDHSRLESGSGNQSLLRYRNPNTDFSKFDKIVIVPVQIWLDPDSNLGDLPKQDQQALADYFHAALTRELKKDYDIVAAPGAGTMRVRTALTEADSSAVAVELVSHTLSPAIALTYLSRVTTGTHLFVGEASAEMEVTDSGTGELLAQAVDRRAGGRTIEGAFDSVVRCAGGARLLGRADAHGPRRLACGEVSRRH